jgi:hypothetical protein
MCPTHSDTREAVLGRHSRRLRSGRPRPPVSS